MKTWCVYAHIFPNGKRYIGITSKRPEARWEGGTGYTQAHQPVMFNAIQKYGWENVRHEILFDNLTESEAKQKEIELIAQYKTNCCRYGDDFGYNMTDGGESRNGGHASDKVRIANRNRLLGKRGKDCCNSRPVICDGVEYESLTQFREMNNFPRGNLNGWLSGQVGMPKYWYDKQLHYKDTDFSIIKLSQRQSMRHVVIDGKEFESQVELACYLNVTPSTLYNWLSNKNNPPQDIIDRGLRFADEDSHEFSVQISGFKRPVECDGIVFESERAVAKYLGLKAGTIHAWLIGKNSMPIEYRQRNLHLI